MTEDGPPPDDPRFAPQPPPGQRGGQIVPFRPRQDSPSAMKGPHDLDLEREVIAALIVDASRDSWDAASEILTGEDFYFERHRALWSAIAALWDQDVSPDGASIRSELLRSGIYEKIGGAKVFSEILDRSGTVANIAHFAELVKQKAIARAMLDAARSVEVAALQDPDDIGEFLSASEAAVEAVSERMAPKRLDFTDLVTSVGEEVLGASSETAPIKRQFGIAPLDEWSAGALGGETWVFMAPPGVGKTAFALGNFALHQVRARHEDYPDHEQGGVAYFSCEMGPRRLTRRLLSGMAGIHPRALRNRDLTDEQTNRLMVAMDEAGQFPLHFERMVTSRDLLRICKRLKRRGVPCGRSQFGHVPLVGVVVDYIGRMKTPKGLRPGFEAITEAMHDLQEGFGDLGLVGVVLTQPSTESRRTQKQNLSGADAKGAGAIEEDADFFGILERDPDNRESAGLRITKGRETDGNLPHWHAVPERDKGGMVTRPACGWMWRGAQIWVPPEHRHWGVP